MRSEQRQRTHILPDGKLFKTARRTARPHDHAADGTVTRSGWELIPGSVRSWNSLNAVSAGSIGLSYQQDDADVFVGRLNPMSLQTLTDMTWSTPQQRELCVTYTAATRRSCCGLLRIGRIAWRSIRPDAWPGCDVTG